MATRFVNEIHYPALITRIVNTYIRPVVEYNSIIWNHVRPSIVNKLDEVLHRSTRVALNLPIRPNHPRYVNFETRLARKESLAFRERRIISSILFIIKIIEGVTETDLKEEIVNLLHVTVRITRNPTLFDVTRWKRHFNSPLIQILMKMNVLKDYFWINDSIGTTKAKLKQYFIDNRANKLWQFISCVVFIVFLTCSRLFLFGCNFHSCNN